MHYIRFLKVPRLVRIGRDQRTLNAKITITTDLGESFLATDVGVEVLLEDSAGNSVPSSKPIRYSWLGKNGMRALEVSIPVPKRHAGLVKMTIRPIDPRYTVTTFTEILNSSPHGGIAAVHSMSLDADSTSATEPLAERRFGTHSGNISIWEETGESIARHIWDAGLVLSAYISQLSPHLSHSSNIPISLPRLPTLETLLRKKNLNILELGAGCGIVGLTITHSVPHISNLILTDLPEASEILSRNLWPLNSPSTSKTKPKISHQVLNWSSPLPPTISTTKWDLVVVADCTYNPDVVPDLVDTLVRLREGERMGEEGLVLLAMKVRHESEMAFFELMRDRGFRVREKCGVGLGMVGAGEDEGEEIEIFVFGKG